MAKRTPQPAPHAADAPMSGGVTIDDVAALAHVSTATVSRVMNNRPVVAAPTRQRVLAAIDQLQFRPSPLGRGLATRRTGAIGLVIADITNPFYPEIVRGVERAAASYGSSVLLYDTAEDSEREAQALHLLRERRVDGVIVCASRLPEERIAAVAHARIPLVLINRRLALPSLGMVDVDQEAGVREAMAHLLALGHRAIAYVGGPPASQVQQRRLAAFRQICADRGLTVPDAYIVTADPTVEGGKDAGRLLLGGRRALRPIAVLAYNDLIAIGVLIAAQEAGIAVPDELSVVGHDDIPLAGVLHPALTTVRQPMRELGAEAVHLLHAHRHKGAAQKAPVTIRLRSTLVVRGSTAPAPPV